MNKWLEQLLHSYGGCYRTPDGRMSLKEAHDNLMLVGCIRKHQDSRRIISGSLS